MGRKAKPDLGREGLNYLEALQTARSKLLDGYAKNDAIAYALDKYELPADEQLNLTKHITEKGALA